MNIIELAEQAGIGFLYGENWACSNELTCFAELVAAAEREACAKVCEHAGRAGLSALQCAAAIRAKGDMSTKPQNVYTSEERVHEIDIRKAAEMALAKLEHLWDIGIDAEYKVELLPEIEALRTALAQNPLDIADRAYFAGKQAGIEEALAQPEQNKRVCNTCNGTGIVKGLHNWAGGGKRTESCWACHEVAQSEPWDTSDMAYRPNGLSVEQEPVAWDGDCVLGHCGSPDGCDRFGRCRAAPPSKPWVSLTDEERKGIREWQRIQEELGPVWAPMMLYLYDAIEAALKEKNNV